MTQATWDNNWGKGWPGQKTAKPRANKKGNPFQGIWQGKNNSAGQTPDWNTMSYQGQQLAEQMLQMRKEGYSDADIKYSIDNRIPTKGLAQQPGFQFPSANMKLHTSQYSAPGTHAMDQPYNSYYGGSRATNEKKSQGNIAIEKNKDSGKGYVEDSLNELSGLTWGQVGDQINAMADMQTEGEGGAWYDDLWQGAKDMGIKGWGELGLGAYKAYQGWQANERAKEQYGLARETLDYQKKSYEQNRQDQMHAFNTNAQNVNAWKTAQGRTDLNTLMV